MKISKVDKMKLEKPVDVKFKYHADDEPERLSLGVPERVSVEKGNWRDGGVSLYFETSSCAIGINQKFELYLYAEDIGRIIPQILDKFIETEPERAKRVIEYLIETYK